MNLSRRNLPLLFALPLLVACSDSGPDKADALEQIKLQLRKGLPEGEQRIDNLSYQSGRDLGQGRYEVKVGYDLTSLVPTMGLFSTVNNRGSAQHIDNERYVFVKASGGWSLE